VVRSEMRLEQDLQRAQNIQMHLMPGKVPSIPGLELALRFQPARELGGDLYEFLNYGRERHVIVVGDVSGKGAPAALYGAMVSGILRSLAPLRLSPPEMLRKLNVMLLERKIEGHFITLIFAVWEPKTRTLRIANAGMPLPVLIRKGRIYPVRVEGVPLGLLENTDYEEKSLTLEKDDLLALYSDGLAEAAKPSHEEFGNRRLESSLRENVHRPLAQIIETLFAEVTRYEAGQRQRDDQTLLLIRAR